MPRLVRVVTADETVEFNTKAVILSHKPEGVRIAPRPSYGDNELGFLSLFFPWGEIRQIKEYDRE